MKKRLRLILIGPFFALMFVHVGVHTYVAMRFNPAFYGTGLWLKQEGKIAPVVRMVAEDGPAAALRANDEILMLKDNRYGTR